MQYTVDYFIDKFEKIPEKKWCVETRANDYGQRCALGWCYHNKCDAIESMEFFAFQNDEDSALTKMFFDFLGLGVGGVNNGLGYGGYTQYQQPTPKQRILAALYDIKNMQQRKDITASLAQDAVQERLDVVKVKEVERV